MTTFDRMSRRQLLGGAAAATLMASTGRSFGQSPDSVKMSLEFRIYGGNAPMFLAQDRIYAKHNLTVTADGSSGSDECVRRVAAGAYPFGLADASTVVAFAGLNPKLSPKIIMPIFDRFPACIISFKKKPVNSVEDLKKVKIGSGSADAGAKLFPVLMALNNIDMKSLDITTLDVKLRDAMLMTGKVDAVIAFDYTSVFNLVGNGVKMDDINIFYFSDMGFGMFGNSLIAHPDVVANNPDLVRRVAAATADAWIYGAAHRAEAIDAVVKRDKLLDAKVELQRLSWVYDKHVITPNVKANGLGTADLDRMKKAIALCKDGFQLPVAPAVEDIYDGRFMPTVKDRTFA
jgi:NitT/TauT family transport system substrate-binding protein